MIDYLKFEDGETIVCDGYLVPNLMAFRTQGRVELVLDRRFALDVPPNIAEAVIGFVANAMAVGAGYTSFGENCSPANPYKTRMTGVTLDAPEEGSK